MGPEGGGPGYGKKQPARLRMPLQSPTPGQGMAGVLGSPPLMWETQKEFLASGLSLVQPQLLRAFGG